LGPPKYCEHRLKSHLWECGPDKNPGVTPSLSSGSRGASRKSRPISMKKSCPTQSSTTVKNTRSRACEAAQQPLRPSRRCSPGCRRGSWTRAGTRWPASNRLGTRRREGWFDVYTVNWWTHRSCLFVLDACEKGREALRLVISGWLFHFFSFHLKFIILQILIWSTTVAPYPVCCVINIASVVSSVCWRIFVSFVWSP
jgi:hypothetical protein